MDIVYYFGEKKMGVGFFLHRKQVVPISILALLTSLILIIDAFEVMKVN